MEPLPPEAQTASPERTTPGLLIAGPIVLLVGAIGLFFASVYPYEEISLTIGVNSMLAIAVGFALAAVGVFRYVRQGRSLPPRGS